MKGFLEEGESIQQDLSVYDLNTMVLVPSFESLGEAFDLEVQKLSDKYNLPYELLLGY